MESTEAISEAALQRATPDVVVAVLDGVELPLALELALGAVEAESEDEAEGVPLAELVLVLWLWVWPWAQPGSRNIEAAATMSRRPFLTRMFVMRKAFRRHLPESTAARQWRRIGVRIVMFRTPTQRTRYWDTEALAERLRKNAAAPSPSPATPAIKPAQLRACEPSSVTEAACSVEMAAAR